MGWAGAKADLDCSVEQQAEDRGDMSAWRKNRRPQGYLSGQENNGFKACMGGQKGSVGAYMAFKAEGEPGGRRDRKSRHGAFIIMVQG